MTGRCGTDGCFYSLFSSQKSPRTQIRAGISLRCRGRTWGNLPIEAEGSIVSRGRLRYPRKGAQRAGEAGLKDRWGWDGGRSEAGARSKRPGRPKTGMGAAEHASSVLPPAVPAKKGQRAGGRKRAGSACGTGPWAAAWRTGWPCQGAGQMKAPAGRGFTVRRRWPGYGGCHHVMRGQEGLPDPGSQLCAEPPSFSERR